MAYVSAMWGALGGPGGPMRRPKPWLVLETLHCKWQRFREICADACDQVWISLKLSRLTFQGVDSIIYYCNFLIVYIYMHIYCVLARQFRHVISLGNSASLAGLALLISCDHIAGADIVECFARRNALRCLVVNTALPTGQCSFNPCWLMEKNMRGLYCPILGIIILHPGHTY